MSAPRLAVGVVADDFTGATDVASMLVRGGLRTLQVIGVPDGPPPDADAVVVALKSRTAPPAQAVADSLAAWRWLAAAGATRVYFKVCSTFDSTPQGNIGPVAEALMDELGASQAIVCPAFPENGRTVFQGHLFVGEQLLSDSGMRHHPLTPMTDSNLVRVMQAQCHRRVGLLPHAVLARGAAAARERLAALRADGVAFVVADAVADTDLLTLAEAGREIPLWVAGSGLALGLANPGGAGAEAARLDPQHGGAAVLAGSCSTATLGQVADWLRRGLPARTIDARALAAGAPVVAEALDWARAQVMQGRPPLLHAGLPAAELRAVQDELGTARAGELVEQAMAQLARGLVERGVQRLVVAGGETSGAVVQALGVRTLRIGAPICPGVPWTQVQGRPGAPLWLALKSGNFGAPGFFADALGLGGA